MRECEKDLQLGKNIRRDERIVPETHTGPQCLFPPTRLENLPFTGRRGAELGKPRLSSEHDQPRTEQSAAQSPPLKP